MISRIPAALWARADQSATIQIIDNLISNAVKYSPSKTAVTVQTSVEEEFVVVAVQDQGPGISQADQKKMFGRYVRLSAKPTGGESSTGLGLSIVKKLAEAMGGAVECQSILGCGSTFALRLPRWKDTLFPAAAITGAIRHLPNEPAYRGTACASGVSSSR